MTKLGRSNKELSRKIRQLFQVILALKMVFGRFNEHFPRSQFKVEFLSYCSSQCPEFENIYFLTTLNKTYKNHEKMNNTFQTCQGKSDLLKLLNTEDKKNENLIVQRISTIVKRR